MPTTSLATVGPGGAKRAQRRRRGAAPAGAGGGPWCSRMRGKLLVTSTACATELQAAGRARLLLLAADSTGVPVAHVGASVHRVWPRWPAVPRN